MSKPEITLPDCADGPEASENFTDLTRRLLSVPRAEYEEEARAVEAGKPLIHDFRKRANPPTPPRKK